MAYKQPDHFRYAERASQLLGLKCETLDGGGGYLYAVSDGEREVILGAGRISAYPINPVVAVSSAKDKIFTNILLDRKGIPHLGGRPFFLNEEDRKLRHQGFELEDARLYLGELGFPCFVKPLSGSRGDFAQVLWTMPQFEEYVQRLRRKHDSLVLQPVYLGTEFRVFVFDAEPIFCLRKSDLTLVGDGEHDIAFFLSVMNRQILGRGLSPIPENELHLDQSGNAVEPSHVLAPGEKVTLVGRRNLSGGADIGELLGECPVELGKLAVRATEALGLRIAGVDLMQIPADSSLRVIEVNASPGIHSLEVLNRWDLIESIWTRVLRVALGSER